MTSSGIEPVTFRFVAEYLNHCATISGLNAGVIFLKTTAKERKTDKFPAYTN
jgi:hypothetical protein